MIIISYIYTSRVNYQRGANPLKESKVVIITLNVSLNLDLTKEVTPFVLRFLRR